MLQSSLQSLLGQLDKDGEDEAPSSIVLPGGHICQAPSDFSSPLFSHSNQAVQGTLQTKSGLQVPSGAKHGPLSCLSSAPGIDSPDLLLTLQPCAVLDTKNLLIIRS